MNQSTVNMVWVGNSISQIEALCMKSFIRCGMSVKLHAYNVIKGVPKEVEVCDANKIVLQKNIFKHMGSYAAFSDLFRWKLMFDEGGYYVDADVICLKGFDFQEDVVIGWESESKLITPTILGFNYSGHALSKQMLDNALNPLSIRPYDTFRIKKKKILKRLMPKKVHALGWGESAGPIGLNNEFILNKEKYGIVPLPQNTFYRIPYLEWEKFVVSNGANIDDLRKTSYAAHLWNEMWRQNGINKNEPFPKTSFIGQAMERYW